MQSLLAQPERLVILVCWALIVALWVVSSFWAKPVAEKAGRGWSAALTLAIAAIVLLFRFGIVPASVNLGLWRSPTSVEVTADALTLLGAGFLVWARLTLGTNWSANVTFKIDHQMVQAGPYRLVRHPIYTGFLLMILGSAVFYGHLLGVAAFFLCLAAFVIKLTREEALMLKHFPDQYAEYRRRVRALVPYIV